MASLMKSDPEKDEADDDSSAETESRPARGGGGGQGKTVEPGDGGFFTIYKKGQGYWTRMLTAAGAALIILLTLHFLYIELQSRIPYLQNHRSIHFGIVAGLGVAMAVLVYRLMNKPNNVDFLIATDSEMKKVNWTSRTDLIGSTKVVILFVFGITAVLFLIDLLFGYAFYLFGILKTKPF